MEYEDLEAEAVRVIKLQQAKIAELSVRSINTNRQTIQD
jgi:hypothetical protein